MMHSSLNEVTSKTFNILSLPASSENKIAKHFQYRLIRKEDQKTHWKYLLCDYYGPGTADTKQHDKSLVFQSYSLLNTEPIFNITLL